MNNNYIPTLHATPDKLLTYMRYEGVRNKKILEKQTYIENFTDNAQKGKVSDKAKKRLEIALSWLLLLAEKKTIRLDSGKKIKFEITFVTLTLASEQLHTDKFIKENMLNQFFVEAKKKWNVQNYIWRAESQKNGNIHFHIITDKYIPHVELRQVWQRIQDKYGYVARYSNKMTNKYKNGFFPDKNLKHKISEQKQYDRYKVASSEGWYNPNCTDIHSIVNVKSIKKYISKYVSKNETVVCSNEFFKRTGIKRGNQYLLDNQTELFDSQLYERFIEGNVWYLSENLSKYDTIKSDIDWSLTEELQTIFQSGNYNTFSNKYCSIAYVEIGKLDVRLFNKIYLLFKEYLDNVDNPPNTIFNKSNYEVFSDNKPVLNKKDKIKYDTLKSDIYQLNLDFSITNSNFD